MLWAADAQVDSPVIGHVFDSKAGGVRAVLGIPGSACMSDLLLFDGFKPQAAWIAPGRSYGLAATAEGRLYRIDMVGRSATELAAAVPEHVAWSPSGIAAALQYSTGKTRVLLNVDSTPTQGMEVAVATGAPLAVSDDGGVLITIVARENGKLLTQFMGSNQERVLLSAPGLNDAQFLFGSRDAVVSDDVEGKIYLFRESGELAVLAQVESATALAVARDNSRIFIASTQRRNVTGVRISDGTRSVIDCSCVPGAFLRLQEDVFAVSDVNDGPLWLFNGAAPENRFTFVPQPEGTRE
jgi:hypothetical protein